MKNNRKNFIKLSGMAGFGLAGKSLFKNIPYYQASPRLFDTNNIISRRCTVYFQRDEEG